MGNTYRPEVDGLRAIAVLAVIAYHAGLGGAGYVGVDVFFVISGYLITGLLLQESDRDGRIDLLGFYARRARRILPALVLVVAVTLAVGLVLLVPAQQQLLGKSAAASLLFVANVYFPAIVGGYFDVHANELPLLHLWSLSVEEQFYLAWPALLMVVLSARRHRAAGVIACLGVLSFVFATVALDVDPEIAFFQMPARFWELAAGGLVAASGRRIAPGWGAVGLALVLAACAWPVLPFPGIGAAPAVAGACLVVAASDGIATRLLASRPMVAVGLVSYGLYLWHWPLLALYRATSIGETDLRIRLALCAIAALLAIASYRYVEQPIRKRRGRALPTVLAGVSASSALALAGVLLVLHARSTVVPIDPLAERAGTDAMSLACHGNFADGPEPKCPPPAGSRIAIWGDSMAWSWTPALQSADPALMVLTRDACAPLVGYLPESAHPPERTCLEANRRNALRVSGLRSLVLVARWTNEPRRFAALDRTLDVIAPTIGQVVIIGPTPELRDAVPRCIERHRQAACAVPRSEFDAEAAPILVALRRVASAHPNVRVFDPSDRLCTRASCPGVLRGVPLYIDSHHLTASAVRAIGVPGVAAPSPVP